MKIVSVCCTLVLLTGGVSAQQDEKVKLPSIPAPSLKDKDALKKIPRLGMTAGQLQLLWGSSAGGGSGSHEYFLRWGNVGGLNVQAGFAKGGFSEIGKRERTDKEPCEKLTFSYVNEEISLVFGDVVRIAEALLPGFTFERPMKDEAAWDSPSHVLVSTDENGTYHLFQSGSNSYCIEFAKPPQRQLPEKKIDTDKL